MGRRTTTACFFFLVNFVAVIVLKVVLDLLITMPIWAKQFPRWDWHGLDTDTVVLGVGPIILGALLKHVGVRFAHQEGSDFDSQCTVESFCFVHARTIIVMEIVAKNCVYHDLRWQHVAKTFAVQNGTEPILRVASRTRAKAHVLSTHMQYSRVEQQPSAEPNHELTDAIDSRLTVLLLEDTLKMGCEYVAHTCSVATRLLLGADLQSLV